MKYPRMATGMLIVGLIGVIPLSGLYRNFSIETPSKKPATAPTSDDPKGQPTRPGAKAPHKKWATAVGMPVYKPPLRGAPGGRVGGGSRGTGNETLTLSALAPDHTGLTAQEQPSLYGYLSKSTPYPLEWTLIEAQAIRPLLETRMGAPVQPGVQRVRLADYGVRLSIGVQYKWFVTLVVDPDNRSKDIMAGGVIERIDLPEALPAKLAQASRAEAPHIYAEAGLWYDALTAISDLIDAIPDDPSLREQRASLLEQGGLPEVAEYEMNRDTPDRP